MNDILKCRNMKFSEMKNKDVIDRTGKRIGRLIDFHFSWEKDKVELKSIVLGGSKIEEFLESIKVKPDIDPFFSMNVVDCYEDGKLHLSVEYEKLTKPVKLGKKEMRLSELSKLKIKDADGTSIGNIIDVWFDADGHLQFIIGGGFFEELFERLHIKPDIDLIVTQEFIKEISDGKIHLKLTKYQMESTCEVEWEKLKRELTGAPMPTPLQHNAIWLSRSPKVG